MREQRNLKMSEKLNFILDTHTQVFLSRQCLIETEPEIASSGTDKTGPPGNRGCKMPGQPTALSSPSAASQPGLFPEEFKALIAGAQTLARLPESVGASSTASGKGNCLASPPAVIPASGRGSNSPCKVCQHFMVYRSSDMPMSGSRHSGNDWIPGRAALAGDDLAVTASN